MFVNIFHPFDHEIEPACQSNREEIYIYSIFLENLSLTIDRLHSKNVYDKRRHSSGTNSRSFSLDKHSFGVCPNYLETK
jgi:hypothetical protein